MASTLVDLVKIKITSIGTGALTLGGAVDGYRGIEALTNGQQYSYSIQQGGNFEVGRGTYLASGTQLVRSPLYTSTGGTAVNLLSGAEVSFVALAEDFAFLFAIISFLSSQTAGWAGTFLASEDIDAGSWTNTYTTGGATYVQKADASDPTKFCNGFAPTAIVSGDTGSIAAFGLNPSDIPADMSDRFLSDATPGTSTTTAPSTAGSIIQALGTPSPGLGLFFFPQPRIGPL